jgi:hypothetical protein
VSGVARLGVVVPVYGGESTLEELHRRLTAALAALTDDWQIVYVDDGSADRSWAIVEGFATAPRVTALRLIRNYGEHVAITAGLDAVDADHVASSPATCRTIRAPSARSSTPARPAPTWCSPAAAAAGCLPEAHAGPSFALVQFFVKVRYDHRVGNYRLLATGGPFSASTRAAQRERHHGHHGRADGHDRRAAPAAAGGASGYSLYRSARMAFHVLVGYWKPLQLVVMLGATITGPPPSLARTGCRRIPTARCRRFTSPRRCWRCSAASSSSPSAPWVCIPPRASSSR